jgi:hypothetical protein
MEMEPVVEREGFKVDELLALGGDSGDETSGLGVSMRGNRSLLAEAVGERSETSLNEVRCFGEVSS